MLSYLQERSLAKSERGDKVKAVRLPGRRVTTSHSFSARSDTSAGLLGQRPRLLRLKYLTIFRSFSSSEVSNQDQRQSEDYRTFERLNQRGFTLIELVITITVLTILTLGVVPLLKLSVKRQKEDQLRAALRQMRTAIDEFHRDTVGMPRVALGTGGISGGGVGSPGGVGGTGGSQFLDPRSKVVISDPTIFGVDNPDLYPPDLETLVNGVNVIPRAGNVTGAGDPRIPATGVGSAQLSTKKKVYLRSIPIDPMTGEADWEFRSCYDAADSDSWGGENVFDVRSKSKGTALNGEKYSDW